MAYMRLFLGDSVVNQMDKEFYIEEQFMKNRKNILSSYILSFLMLAAFIVSTFIADPVLAANETASNGDGEENVVFRISLDPGHGGVDSGAEANGTSEKKLTLKLAKMIKEELLKYDNVAVKLTRGKDKFVSLKKRTKRALNQNADLMISIHFDSYDPSCDYSDGCSAIVAKKSSYRPAMSKEEMKLARSILQELSRIGVHNRGLIRRLSAEGETYPDGSLADYYGIIRRGVLNALPSILVEHSFIDSDHDFNNFLDSDDKLREMAKADAKGIARYLRLKNKKTGKVPKPSKDHGKTLVCYPKKGSYISIRDKSFLLEQSRKAQGYDPAGNEEDEVEKKLAEDSGEEGSTEEAGTQAAKVDRTFIRQWADHPAESLAEPDSRKKGINLIAILSLLLLAYFAWDILRRRRG